MKINISRTFQLFIAIASSYACLRMVRYGVRLRYKSKINNPNHKSASLREFKHPAVGTSRRVTEGNAGHSHLASSTVSMGYSVQNIIIAPMPV